MKTGLNTITDKLSMINTLQNDIDGKVWDVINKYIELKRINFSGPSEWRVEDEHIYVSGEDGCRGCYENMDISIPIEFVIDWEKAEAAYIKEEAEKKKKDERSAKKYIKRKQAEQLKKEMEIYYKVKAKMKAKQEGK